MTDIQKRLFSMSDPKYKSFHSRLIPNIKEEYVIGVRTPDVRAYAKEFYGTKEAEDFIESLPHKYYEENNLHAFLLEQIKEKELLIERLDKFLPCVDNWATCDSLSPRLFYNDKKLALDYALSLLKKDSTYEKRFGICILMKHFLGSDFNSEYLSLVAVLDSDDYYLKMAVAWFFATALAKQYNASLPFIEEERLPLWTHNKTISKACESFRISEEYKSYLKGLRR